MAAAELATCFCRSLNSPSATPSSETKCPICLETFSADFDVTSPGQGRRIVETPCQHIFHYMCLRQWVSIGAPSCPNCRKVFYTSLMTPEARDRPHSSDESNQPSESMYLPPWGGVARGYDIALLPHTAPTIWSVEDHALLVFGQLRWRQRRRLAFEMSAHTHSEERRRQVRYLNSRVHREQIIHSFWPLP